MDATVVGVCRYVYYVNTIPPPQIIWVCLHFDAIRCLLVYRSNPPESNTYEYSEQKYLE